MQSAIQKNVMRRVYYSYALSVVSHQMFWQGMLLGGSVALFGRLTHVASLIHNFLSVPIGGAPKYLSSAFVNAFSSGELVTIVVTVCMIALTVSFVGRLLSLVPMQLRKPAM